MTILVSLTAWVSLRWQDNIARLLLANDLKLLVAEPVQYRDPWRQAWAHSALLGLEDMAAFSEVEARDSLIDYTDRLAKEIEQGVHFEMDLVCWVAQKFER